MINGRVESVTLIEHLGTNLDYCSIQIEFDNLKVFGEYNKLMEFIGKWVQYDVRQDVYKGAPITVVANLADVYTVQTVDKVSGVRLIPEFELERAVCNFAIKSLRTGDSDIGCVAFLSGYERGSSDYSKWINCKMVDRESKAFVLRIFTKNVADHVDAEDVIANLVGRYVKFDITSTQYGYQTKEIELYNVPVVEPPEVAISINVINEAVRNDEELKGYMEQYDFINTLRGIIDYEVGYHLVRVASEITMIETLNNISSVYDTKTLIRATIVSRGYLLAAKTRFSRPVLNINKLMRTKLVSDKELILILDPLSEEETSATSRVYIEIKKFVEGIIKERRGESVEEVSSSSNIINLRNNLGGLL